MKCISIGFVALTAVSLPLFAAERVQDNPTVPATAIERPENNPAKAAVIAREALRKDEAADKQTALEGMAPRTTAQLEAPALLQRVEAALHKDTRTSDLGIELRVDTDGIIGLHGKVPTPQSRTVAQNVASAVAGADRIHNHLEVSVPAP